MRGECTRNYADCKLCPDKKNCPYENDTEEEHYEGHSPSVSEEINKEIAQERGREVEWKNKENER